MLSNLAPEKIEELIGIQGYVARGRGIGGVIKLKPEDFLTWEILTDGSNAKEAYESWDGLSKGIGDFILAIMRKRRIDTIRAVTLIAKKLGVKPKTISICGIKDKMSISWQFITIPSSPTLANELRIDETIHVLPLRYTLHKLTSKDLAKNAFEITIRKTSGKHEEAIQIIQELKSRGLPNYYGHQRFGITRPITPIIGRLVMEEKLEEAVITFLTAYSPLESSKNREAREKLSNDFDPAKALEYYPKTLRYERMMLNYLTRKPNDYQGALRSLPLRLRRLMIESVSALIFNKTLSKIISSNLLNELELGDLVIKLDIFGRPEPGRPIEVIRGNIDQIERLVKQGKFGIILPVPGYLSPIPKSRKGELLLKTMKELKIDLKMFRLKTLPEASTRGSLRPIIVSKWDCRPIGMADSSLKLSIRLPPGSYATILLREIMKPENPLTFIGKTVNSDGVNVSG